ncbi:MAG: phosphodiester glycosidase family protein [Candidatus Solibacter sp.]|nr:phosphodiester glycosidase family protein [Candidatus Solibacter sp.]
MAKTARWLLIGLWCCWLTAAETVQHPFRGVTYIERVETAPRALRMHVVKIDLAAPGIAFKLSPPGGTLETVRQTTLEFLLQEHAQIAINAHYFLPWPSSNPEASLVGFAASNGTVYSGFEVPAQSYALTPYAPALNIDAENHASIVHRDAANASGTHIAEGVRVWNAVSGSAQIVTGGVKTIPRYDPEGVLQPGGPNAYSNAKSWYAQTNARSAIGISKDGSTLVLFTVDARGGSAGMTVGEVTDVLIQDYGVYEALNLDGGGSTTLAIDGAIVNVSSDNPKGRSVGSSLAVFAAR